MRDYHLLRIFEIVCKLNMIPVIKQMVDTIFVYTVILCSFTKCNFYCQNPFHLLLVETDVLRNLY